MTKDIARLGRKVKKASKQHRRRPSAHSADNLSELRTQLKHDIERAKDYYQSVSLKRFLSTSPEKFWRHLSPKEKKSITSLLIDGTARTDKKEMADALNNYFCSVFTDDDGIIPHFMTLEEVPPIDDISISEEGILSILLKLDVKKSSGIDGTPNTFLHRYAEWCAKFLCLIFRKSLSHAEIPSDWKRARITPIPKKGDPSIVTSYRPISLLCTCAKVLEHIIFKHISNFIEDNKIIDSRQHSFRRGVSTKTQLLESIHNFAAALDKSGQVDIIFLDFEKAFDRVSHPKLLLKLRQLLKIDSLIAWIAAYLSLRQQSVSIDDANSDFASVHSGIPKVLFLGRYSF